jgi:hypothetical protein
MAMPDGGYVKLWRKLLDSPVMRSAELLQLAVYCLLRANHAETHDVTLTGAGNTVVKLLPGQFVWGRNVVGRVLRQPPKSCEHRLHRLADLQFLTIQIATHYSVVTICNWSLYQSEAGAVGQSPCQPPAQHWPSTGPTLATNKNCEVFVSKDTHTLGARAPGTITPSRFQDWWAVYPKKRAKAACLRKWTLARLDPKADRLIDDVKARIARDARWQRGYVPDPLTYLNQSRWEDEFGDLNASTPVLPPMEGQI